jgi:rhomboid protease GluP
VHGSLGHIGNNLIALGLLGFLAERIVGSRWFTAVYLIAGIAGEYVSIVVGPNRVSVGASGAIFGLAGFALVVVWLEKKVAASAKPMLFALTSGYLAINLLVGAFLPGIDLAAHLGGLACGLILGGLRGMIFRQRKHT